MDNLVSGLVGAIVASSLSVLYLWISDTRKLRGEVFVDITVFFDEVWQLIRRVHGIYDEIYGGELMETLKQRGALMPDTYVHELKNARGYRHRLTDLINSSHLRSKLAYVFGEAQELARYDELNQYLRNVITEKLSIRKTDNWPEISKQLHEIFTKYLDGARGDLEYGLMKKTRFIAIMREIPSVLRDGMKRN